MKSPFNISCNLEIDKDGQPFLTIKRVALLKLVKHRGSINAAAKELKMSYQQAWHFIKEKNEISPLPLVIRKRGGTNGGETEVTSFGEKTIYEFEQLLAEQEQFKCGKNNDLWLCFF